MMTITEAIRKFRLPNPSTPEDLEMGYRKVLEYGDKVLVAGHYHQHGKPCWHAAVYEHLDDDLTYIWGFDRDEGRRAEHIRENFPEFKHEFPLIDRGLTKQDAHGMLAMLGIEKPLLYTMGYSNNNCLGCVKGGKFYWNMIRKDFPEVFAKRAKMERDIGMSCINGVFLDELDPNAGRKSEELDNECSLICLYEMGAFN